jgi:hypothetical protein
LPLYTNADEKIDQKTNFSSVKKISSLCSKSEMFQETCEEEEEKNCDEKEANEKASWIACWI